MDQTQTDTLALDGLKASRTLVVQERIDSTKVKALLGDSMAQVMTETPVIRLTVI